MSKSKRTIRFLVERNKGWLPSTQVDDVLLEVRTQFSTSTREPEQFNKLEAVISLRILRKTCMCRSWLCFYSQLVPATGTSSRYAYRAAGQPTSRLKTNRLLQEFLFPAFRAQDLVLLVFSLAVSIIATYCASIAGCPVGADKQMIHNRTLQDGIFRLPNARACVPGAMHAELV